MHVNIKPVLPTFHSLITFSIVKSDYDDNKQDFWMEFISIRLDFHNIWSVNKKRQLTIFKAWINLTTTEFFFLAVVIKLNKPIRL